MHIKNNSFNTIGKMRAFISDGHVFSFSFRDGKLVNNISTDVLAELNELFIKFYDLIIRTPELVPFFPSTFTPFLQIINPGFLVFILFIAKIDLTFDSIRIIDFVLDFLLLTSNPIHTFTLIMIIIEN